MFVITHNQAITNVADRVIHEKWERREHVQVNPVAAEEIEW